MLNNPLHRLKHFLTVGPLKVLTFIVRLKQKTLENFLAFLLDSVVY
ncbi:hypothetical protein LEQ41_01340 [Streptococcus agalactiae]|nr:hypothetical protein [Streptococcus agalactiae]